MPRLTPSMSSAMQLARTLAQRELQSGQRTRRSPQPVAAIDGVLRLIERAAGQGPEIVALATAVRRACHDRDPSR